jgi:prepilin-type N-terminal cleavage/methylation domain-containing protein
VLHQKKQQGYTILEMIVVVAIITALCGIVILNYPKAKLQLSLARVAYKFEQDLRHAQQLSLTSNYYPDSSHPSTGFGGYVNTESNKQYIIYANNDVQRPNYYYPANDYIVNTVDFSKTEPGIIIKEIDNVLSADASINFTTSNSATTITPAPTGNVLYVVFAIASDPTKVKIVSINTSGLIEILSDSQACNGIACFRSQGTPLVPEMPRMPVGP